MPSLRVQSAIYVIGKQLLVGALDTLKDKNRDHNGIHITIPKIQLFVVREAKEHLQLRERQ